MDELYRDQAIESMTCLDRNITSFYTPVGIQRIDTHFHRRIVAFKNGKEFVEYAYNYSHRPPKKEVEQVWRDTMETLTKDITDNPHLHPKIKENLLFNLRRQ